MTDTITADALVRNTVALNPKIAEGVTPGYHNITLQGRVDLGNNNPASALGLTKFVPWGVIYRSKDNPPDNDVLVKVGDLAIYDLSQATGLWSQRQSWTRVSGQIYPAEFPLTGGGDDNAVPSGPAPSYSVSPNMVITQIATAGTAYHFYTQRIDYTALLGIIVVFSAKLVSKTGADLSSKAGCLLGQVGCDFKTADGLTIRASFTSGLMPITKDMRRFAATSMTLAQIMANPPDLSLFKQLTQADPVGLDPDYVPG